MPLRIEFDRLKNESNIALRGLSFDQAAHFDFAGALIAQDSRHVYPEPRFVALGFLGVRLHVLCFTPVTGGIRVISFRKANAREVRAYDEKKQSTE
jgi:uncharacterized DUF497 family protein